MPSIYIYAPPSERQNAERLAQPWQTAAQPCLLSSAADLATLPAHPCAVLIVLYTPALAEDEGLFTLLQRTHATPGLRRFLFLLDCRSTVWRPTLSATPPAGAKAAPPHPQPAVPPQPPPATDRQPAA